MILILDLDDTLYPEKTYVNSGFNAVADYLQPLLNEESNNLNKKLLQLLKKNGRGSIFDQLLKDHNHFSKSLVKKCIAVYRSHKPKISLFSSALTILDNWDGPLYLVTDGNKLVQKRKVEALNIKQYFKKIYITHNFGVRNAKPSIHCFQKIKEQENCDWSDIIYIGDDPNKDFVNLNKKKIHTVRVLTGRFKHQKAKHGFDGAHSINGLDEFPKKFIDDIRK